MNTPKYVLLAMLVQFLLVGACHSAGKILIFESTDKKFFTVCYDAEDDKKCDQTDKKCWISNSEAETYKKLIIKAEFFKVGASLSGGLVDIDYLASNANQVHARYIPTNQCGVSGGQLKFTDARRRSRNLVV